MDDWMGGVLGGLFGASLGSGSFAQQQAAGMQLQCEQAKQAQAVDRSVGALQGIALAGYAKRTVPESEESRLAAEIAELEYMLMFKPPRYVEPWWLRVFRWLAKVL